MGGLVGMLLAGLYLRYSGEGQWDGGRGDPVVVVAAQCELGPAMRGIGTYL